MDPFLKFGFLPKALRRSMKLNQAIHEACQLSSCIMMYVVLQDGKYLVCNEQQLYDEFDQAQVICCAFDGKWEW